LTSLPGITFFLTLVLLSIIFPLSPFLRLQPTRELRLCRLELKGTDSNVKRVYEVANKKELSSVISGGGTTIMAFDIYAKAN